MNTKLFAVSCAIAALVLGIPSWADVLNTQNAAQSTVSQTGMQAMTAPQMTAQISTAPTMQRLETTTSPYKDISEQFTGYEGSIPVIVNPTSCGKNRLEIKIDVDNVEKGEGSIVADLHDNIKENFLNGDKVLLRIRAKATQGRTSFCIPMRESGEYAIAFYHDKNDNKKFDKGFMGIPKEHFGMSNNPKFGLKSPDYEQAAFQMPATGAHLIIKLRKASDFI